MEKARAIATVTLEIDISSSWGDDCTVGQVYKQAHDSAVTIVDQVLKARYGIRLVKPIEVTAVVTPNKRG